MTDTPLKASPSKTTLKTWARLVRAHHRAISQVEGDLKAADLPPLAWYDALLELERAGDDGLRPNVLQDHLLLPQYGLSRLLARLEDAGYVRRTPCSEDGRGQVFAITEAGRHIRERMWPVYAAALEATIGTQLTARESADLSALLAKLIKPSG